MEISQFQGPIFSSRPFIICGVRVVLYLNPSNKCCIALPLYPNRLFPREGRTTSWSTFQTCTKISLHWQLLRLILNISKRLSDWMTSLFTTTDCIRYKTAVSLQLYLLDQENFFFFKFWLFLKWVFKRIFIWTAVCHHKSVLESVMFFFGPGSRSESFSWFW